MPPMERTIHTGFAKGRDRSGKGHGAKGPSYHLPRVHRAEFEGGGCLSSRRRTWPRPIAPLANQVVDRLLHRWRRDRPGRSARRNRRDRCSETGPSPHDGRRDSVRPATSQSASQSPGTTSSADWALGSTRCSPHSRNPSGASGVSLRTPRTSCGTPSDLDPHEHRPAARGTAAAGRGEACTRRGVPSSSQRSPRSSRIWSSSLAARSASWVG